MEDDYVIAPSEVVSANVIHDRTLTDVYLL